MYTKDKDASRHPKIRALQMRISKDGDIDRGESLHMTHIRTCVETIEEVEANKKGTAHEKAMDANEKYKLALYFMQMLEDPKQFAYLDRFAQGEDSQVTARMNLKPADLPIYRELLA